jgi:hypothetical protein
VSAQSHFATWHPCGPLPSRHLGCDADVAQHGAGEFGKEALDEIEPGAVLGSESKFEPVCGLRFFPTLYGAMTFSYELGRPSLHFVKNHPAPTILHPNHRWPRPRKTRLVRSGPSWPTHPIWLLRLARASGCKVDRIVGTPAFFRFRVDHGMGHCLLPVEGQIWIRAGSVYVESYLCEGDDADHRVVS